MKITFYGAAQAVTGSKHLLEINGQRILLDCGLVQGRRNDAYAANVTLPFDPASIDLLVLSHAHIDHSGAIPNLVKRGFKGDVLCTSATRDLCAAMLPDSGHIQERDAEFVNKKHAKRGDAPVEPIYTQQEAQAALNSFITYPYHRTREIAKGVHLTFLDAGHMLGSAIVVLDIDDHEAKRALRFVFSGDLGRKEIPILRDPEFVDRADVVIMESTYGDRLHNEVATSEHDLEAALARTFKRGGSVVIPAFAVGRTQQIVYTLHKLDERGDMPNMPIYVDSPLAVDATSIFGLHPECYDSEMRAFIGATGQPNPFGFEHVHYVRQLEESKRLNFAKQPSIIISASGMAEFGRVVHHIKNRIEDAANTLLFVGYQAEQTLGRKLVDGEKKVRIFGEEYPVRAEVVQLDGFSGHADRDDLLGWVEAMQQRPRQIFLVHGEMGPASALRDALHSKFNIPTEVPAQGQTVEV